MAQHLREPDKLIGSLDGRAPRKSEDRDWVKGGHKNGWYLPATNLYPTDQALFMDDLRQVVREFVLPGHVPAAPLLDESKTVVTVGSCFARELRLFLSRAGVDAARFMVPPGLNNTYAMLDFFAWCATGEQTGAGFRYERVADGGIREWQPENKRRTYADFFAGVGAFVITVGLAEVWQDRETGGVFWRGIPDEIFDAGRHVFRLTTVDENAANLRRMVDFIRLMNPTAPIVLTLSPVPLVATFREVSCLTADCVSKSVLRVALDLVLSDKRDGVYYWPSFEIVKWLGANTPRPSYGAKGKARQIDRSFVRLIMDEFVQAFYTEEARTLIQSRATEAPSDEAEGED